MDDQQHNDITTQPKFTVPKQLHQGFSLGHVIVEPDLGVIIRDNERYHLAPKAMEVLVFLAAMDCKIVSREQILEFGWGDTGASKTNITHIISEIRHVLDDHKECPTYIQTIPRKGYRMMLPTGLKTNAGLFDLDANQPAFANPKAPRWKLSIALLKSNRLFKASAAYLVFSWVLLQVLALVLPIFNSPAWGVKLVTLILIIGFPLVISYQWLKALKQRRIQAINDHNRKKFLYQQLAFDSVFVLAVVGTIFYLSTHLITFIEDENEAENKAENILTSKLNVKISENAVAVLAFTSQANSQIPEYLLTGLQEELVSLLTIKPEFQVASLRATNDLVKNASINEIKSALGVKYILEGKAKINGDQLIIVTTMIDTITGFQVWAVETEGNLQQALSLYEELSRKVVNALYLLVPEAIMNDAETRTMATQNFAAYDAYLQGKGEYRNTKSITSLTKAQQLFKQALTLDPNFIQASAALCVTYMELYRLDVDPESYKNGVEVCELTASYKQVGIEAYLALGKLYWINGRYQLAQQKLEQALTLNEHDPEVLLALASVYYDLKNNSKAEQIYLQVIEIEPSYWRNYYQYGTFLYTLGKYQQAIVQFNKANLLNNQVALTYNALGGAYFLTMDIENASIAWSKALAIEPTALTYSNLGTSLFFLLQFDNAIEVYLQSVKLTPNDNIVWGNLGDAYKYSENKQDNAREAYQQALLLAKQQEQINPNDINVQAQIARYYSELGQCKTSDSYQQVILKNISNDPYVYYDLSIKAINCQQILAAENMLLQALNYGYPKDLLLADPQFLVYKEQLSQLYSE